MQHLRRAACRPSRDAVTGLWAHYRPGDPIRRRPTHAIRSWWNCGISGGAGWWRAGTTECRAHGAAQLRLKALSGLNADHAERRQPALARRQPPRGRAAATSQHTLCSVEGIEVADWPADARCRCACPHWWGGLRRAWSGSARIFTARGDRHGLRAAETCDVFLCVGTSTLVYPAAELPLSRTATGPASSRSTRTKRAAVPGRRLPAGRTGGVVLLALVEALANDAVTGADLMLAANPAAPAPPARGCA